MHLRVEIILYFPTETDIKYENHCSKLCILVSVYYYKSCVSVEVSEWVYCVTSTRAVLVCQSPINDSRGWAGGGV